MAFPSLAMDLLVTPKLCITDNADKTCELSLDFEWQTNDQGDYCLINKNDELKLQCWRQDTQGQWQTETQVQNQDIFWMTEEGRAEPLAEAVIEVLSTFTEDRRRNRRRKHVWSIM